MKNYLAKSLILAVLIFSFLEISAKENDAEYYSIYEAFKIYGKAFESLSNNYVNDLQAKGLLEESLSGMVNELDPYTRFVKSKDAQDADYLISGQYSGFGFKLNELDDKKIITDVLDKSEADLNGLRVGDYILEIDNIKISNLSFEETGRVLQNEAGISSIFKFIRPGIKDTFEVTMKRKYIELEDIPYTKLIDDSIIYIKLDQFSLKARYEVKSVIRRMAYDHNIKGIILDLRDNPGGLLSTAVNLCELFLPKSSLVVTTRGKNKNDISEYYTMSEPEFPDQKLAILINENSASASEVVAGAIQDLDRGVIIGRKSFGKGLVQNIVEFQDGSMLRITTAKYYTPSGRCIQKLNYNIKENKYDQEQDMFFKTKNGRTVNKEDGISPDKIVEYKERPKIYEDLNNSYLIFKFAVLKASEYNLGTNVEVDDIIFDEFIQYLKDNQSVEKLNLMQDIKKLKNKKYSDILSDETNQNMFFLEKSLKVDIFNSISENKNQIKKGIKNILDKVLLDRKEYFNNSFTQDNFITKALDTFKANYFEILNTSSSTTAETSNN